MVTSFSGKKEVLSPPAYASDHVVHFGRWQSNTCKKPNTPPYYTSSFPSPTMSSPTLSQSSINHNHLCLPPIHDHHIQSPPITNTSTNNDCTVIEPFYRLPPLRDIIHNKHSSDTYAPPLFPIDYSFFK
jgi:hypothetical protein